MAACYASLLDCPWSWTVLPATLMHTGLRQVHLDTHLMAGQECQLSMVSLGSTHHVTLFVTLTKTASINGLSCSQMIK